MKVSNLVPSYAMLKGLEHANKIWSNFSNFEDALKNCGYSVYDVETSLVKDGVSIFSKPPEFVLGQLNRHRSNGEEFATVYHSKVDMSDAIESWVIHVGHNLPYDFNALDILPAHDSFYWDTSVAQYLLTNQAMTYPSLQDSCAYYKIPMTKEDKVSEMIKAGVEPKDIPQSLLMEYLDNDVQMTNALFLAQLEDLRKRNVKFQNLVLQQMQWRTNTYGISKLGIQLDIPRVKESMVTMTLAAERLEKNLLFTMEDWFRNSFITLPTTHEFKNPLSLQSPKQIALYLYGGTIEFEVKTQIGSYKTGPKVGTPKYRTVTVEEPVNGHVPNVYSGLTDDKTLNKICDTYTTHTVLVKFCKDLLEYRNITKTLNTYFVGYSSHSDAFGFIHPQFNHTATPTGRLTCTKPNTQNLKGDE